MKSQGIAAIVTGGARQAWVPPLRACSRNTVRRSRCLTSMTRRGREEAERIGGLFCKVNIADDAGTAAAIDAAERKHGVARVLVNCAGISTVCKTVGRENIPHPFDSFRRTVEINLIGTFNMISQGRGPACRMGDGRGRARRDRQHGIGRRL